MNKTRQNQISIEVSSMLHRRVEWRIRSFNDFEPKNNFDDIMRFQKQKQNLNDFVPQIFEVVRKLAESVQDNEERDDLHEIESQACGTFNRCRTLRNHFLGL